MSVTKSRRKTQLFEELENEIYYLILTGPDYFDLIVDERNVHEQRQISECKAMQLMNMSVLDINRAKIFEGLKYVSRDEAQIAGRQYREL